jgi:hypothetical protein
MINADDLLFDHCVAAARTPRESLLIESRNLWNLYG